MGGGLICQSKVSRRLFWEEFQKSDERHARLQGTEEKMLGEKVEKASLSNASNNVFVEEK